MSSESTKKQQSTMKDHFALKNQQNGLVIDIVRLGDEQNKAIIWQPDGGLTQTFCFEKSEDGFYIKSKKDQDLYLTVQGQKNGARIFVTAKNTEDKRQIFRIEKKENDEFVMKTFCNKVIGLSNGGTDKGTHIVQAEDKGENYQIWRLQQPMPMPVENQEQLLDVGHKATIQEAKQGGVGLNN